MCNWSDFWGNLIFFTFTELQNIKMVRWINRMKLPIESFHFNCSMTLFSKVSEISRISFTFICIFSYVYCTLLFFTSSGLPWNFWIRRSPSNNLKNKCVTLFPLFTFNSSSFLYFYIQKFIIFYIQNSKYEFLIIVCFLLDYDIPRGTCTNLNVEKSDPPPLQLAAASSDRSITFVRCFSVKSTRKKDRR
jgi:hypothetical protein